MKKYVVLLVIFALLVSALWGCGATASSQKFESADTVVTMPMLKPEESYGYAEGMTQNSMTMDAGAGAIQNPAPAATAAEKIIYSANVQMETMEFLKTVEALENTIAQFGGFVENSDVNGDTSYLDDGSVHIRNRNAFYSVRIPAERLDEFLQQTGTLGNVTGSSKSAVNVTSQYTDHEARRASLEAQETRLLELVAAAENIDSLIALESKLAEVRYEIENIQRTLNDLDSRIAYSTVDIYVREVEVYEHTPTVQRSLWQRMGDAFVRGWKSFVRGLGNFLVGLSGAIFPLLLVVGIGIGIFFVVRTFLRKKKAKKENKAENE